MWYMNRHRIYIFYMGTDSLGEWCIGPKIGDKSRAIWYQESTAANRLRPDLKHLSSKIDLEASSDSKVVELQTAIF